MPVFHFNIYDDVCLRDEGGTELADMQAARIEAVRFAGAVICDEARRVAIGQDWHMDVTDSTGLILYRLDFAVTASSAVGAA